MKKSAFLFVTLMLIVVVICFTISCQNKAEKAELEKFRAQAKLEEQNKALANRVMEAWSKGDLDTIKEMTAPEFVWYMPSSSTKPMSREETIEMEKMIHRGFPDINFSIEESYADGDRVIMRYILRGTHQGEWAGIPATGNKIESSGICIFWIENGKLVGNRQDSDTVGLMQQLGMELKPKEVKK